MIRTVSLLLVASATCLKLSAFVFYQVTPGNYLRWNVNVGTLHSNVVNKTTQAIRYFIASDAYSSSNTANEINAVRACFDQWQNIPGSKIRFEFAGLVSPDGIDTRLDDRNVVFWAKNNLTVAAGSENISGRRAWTSVNYAPDGSIVEADIVLNGIQYQWFTDFENKNSPIQFVEGALLHEIGHFLGLDHTPAGGATVVNGANGVSTESGVSADEIAAMRFLYPAAGLNLGAFKGVVRKNGSPVLGAMVIVEDSDGNIAGATVSDRDGNYLVPSLSSGNYKLRVTPFDPFDVSGNMLMHAGEIAAEYQNADTSFQATSNTALSLATGQTRTQDFTLIGGAPAVRVLALSRPNYSTELITFSRFAGSIRQGQSNYYTGIISKSVTADAKLSITGTGINVGPTQYIPNRFGIGLHALIVPISVSSNAVPGLRSYVVTQPDGIAYANGYLEIAPAINDYNFDGFEDSFQRRYWSPWTLSSSAPNADPDNDGFSNRFEYRTNTDPTNRESFALRLQVVRPGRFGTPVTFAADLAKKYRLSFSTMLGAASSWQPMGTIVVATNEVMTITDPNRSNARFYRLELVP